jgi:hypothetical protein
MSIAYINPHLIKVSPKIKHATIEYKLTCKEPTCIFLKAIQS